MLYMIPRKKEKLCLSKIVVDVINKSLQGRNPSGSTVITHSCSKWRGSDVIGIGDIFCDALMLGMLQPVWVDVDS